MQDERPSARKTRGIFLPKNPLDQSVPLYPKGLRPKAVSSLGGLFISVLLMVAGTAHAEATMDLTKAVIHHTASSDVSVKTIDKWHKARGWDGIGYHYVIRKDGTIEEGRNINKKGAHARTGKEYSRNHYVGIALTGFDSFTNEQELALAQLLLDLGIIHIEPHHEECPGNGLNIEKLR